MNQGAGLAGIRLRNIVAERSGGRGSRGDVGGKGRNTGSEVLLVRVASKGLTGRRMRKREEE
jgi:hypothetical protein